MLPCKSLKHDEAQPDGFRYSLRQLLGLVTAAALGFSVFNAIRPIFNKGHISDLSPTERQVLAAIERLGITVCEAFT
ncbi:MAG TPA: hypothetical protein VGX78_22905 [Pirellulales bacterium]|jgi:hypothetical protein|nr:hypothetical protein [Pirellulales bacterium]